MRQPKKNYNLLSINSKLKSFYYLLTQLLSFIYYLLTVSSLPAPFRRVVRQILRNKELNSTYEVVFRWGKNTHRIQVEYL